MNATMSSSERKVIGAAAAALLLAPTVLRPAGRGPVLCPLRRLTGVWCPGCGLTRAAGWLAHADWSAAWRYNPWAFALAAQVLALGVIWLAQPACGPGWFGNPPWSPRSCCSTSPDCWQCGSTG